MCFLGHLTAEVGSSEIGRFFIDFPRNQQLKRRLKHGVQKSKSRIGTTKNIWPWIGFRTDLYPQPLFIIFCFKLRGCSFSAALSEGWEGNYKQTESE